MHRDIKGANILVDNKGCIKLADFGASKQVAKLVRTTGRIDQITRQRIGGRKRGGIRFGEMERDAVLAHGASYLLHDRLHSCSDYHIADVCSLSGSLLTARVIKSETHKKTKREMLGLATVNPPKNFACQACKTSKGMETVAMPYVFQIFGRCAGGHEHKAGASAGR